MGSTASPHGMLAEFAHAVGRWAGGWWHVIHLGAVLLVLALSPSSHRRERRSALARFIVVGTAPALPWFTVLSSLISLIVIRIVVVTALSYGLSQYALEMVVRVLVLELIPLTAALFAALRCTIPFSVEVAALRTSGRWNELRSEGTDPLVSEVLPRVIAGVFCALMLAAVSCVVTLVLAYLLVYGATLSGFAGYTHTVGHVFNGAVSLIFGLKILFFGIAVAVLPIATMLDETPRRRAGMSAELHGLVRMFLVILLIEGVSLVGNYY